MDNVGPALHGRLLWRDVESNLEVFRQVYFGVRQALREWHGRLRADEIRRAVQTHRQLVVVAVKSILGRLARLVVFRCRRVVVACAHRRAPRNLGQLLEIEVIDQGVGWFVPPDKLVQRALQKQMAIDALWDTGVQLVGRC